MFEAVRRGFIHCESLLSLISKMMFRAVGTFTKRVASTTSSQWTQKSHIAKVALATYAANESTNSKVEKSIKLIF